MLGIVIDSGSSTFVNHGCNGTYNAGTHSDVTELTADPEHPPEEMLGESHTESATLYNPFIDRHLPYYTNGIHSAVRDIHPGEEILDNYLWFGFDEESWADYVVSLQNECNGGVGEVVKYEQED